MNTERALATIRRVAAIHPIDGADKIEAIIVDGWQAVAQKGLYKVGDLVVYLEIDSFVPHDIAPFLTKPGKKPDVYNEVEGQRLKTVRLRGALSQGLLLPMTEHFTHWENDTWVHTSMHGTYSVEVGDDVTDLLHIQKWEKPINAQLAGIVKGNFPNFIPKTDQERIQNCYNKIVRFCEENHDSRFWEVTEKLDGSSCTVYVNNYNHGVCSRNYDIEYDENNAFWSVVIRDEILQKLIALISVYEYEGIAIQGELVGPGVQGNKYKLDKREFFVFDIFNIEDQKYITPEVRRKLCNEFGLKHVPVINHDFVFHDVPYSEVLGFGDGTSMLANVEREGVVFKNTTFVDHTSGTPSSFKVISNAWLLKNE